jgi:hypothetical protein
VPPIHVEGKVISTIEVVVQTPRAGSDAVSDCSHRESTPSEMVSYAALIHSQRESGLAPRVISLGYNGDLMRSIDRADETEACRLLIRQHWRVPRFCNG